MDPNMILPQVTISQETFKANTFTITILSSNTLFNLISLILYLNQQIPSPYQDMKYYSQSSRSLENKGYTSTGQLTHQDRLIEAMEILKDSLDQIESSEKTRETLRYLEISFGSALGTLKRSFIIHIHGGLKNKDNLDDKEERAMMREIITSAEINKGWQDNLRPTNAYIILGLEGKEAGEIKGFIVDYQHIKPRKYTEIHINASDEVKQNKETNQRLSYYKIIKKISGFA